jgi:hypothetical protein
MYFYRDWHFKPASSIKKVVYPNPKWVSNRIRIVFNRVPIWKTNFGCHERYNPNLSIISPGDLFAEMVLFWVLLEKTNNGY